jgi:hypothetical protein
MPRPRLQRAATARREKVQLRIREQSFRPISPILETVPYDRVYQLNYYRVEGIWNRFRNPILVWEFLKSLNFGRLETVEFRPETLEFRSDISNLGTFLEHFWQSWNFGPFGVSSSSQQRIWYKFESYPYEKTTPDAGDGWARISLFKF